MFVSSGSVGPKLRLKSVDDGHPVNIPEPPEMRYQLMGSRQSKTIPVQDLQGPIPRVIPKENASSGQPGRSGLIRRQEKPIQGVFRVTVPQTNTGGQGE